VSEIEFLSDPTAGELRIGATEPMIASILPVVFNRISRRHPRIVFHVTHFHVGTQQVRELRERKVDLSLGRLVRARKEDDLAVETLFDEPLFVVAGARNPLVRRRKIGFSDLVNEPWILPPPETAVAGFITELFQAGGRDTPPLGIVCSSIQMQHDMIVNGRFLSLFPRSVLRFGTKRMAIKVLPVELPAELTSGLAPVGITTLKNRTISPVAQLFLQTVREIVQPLTKEK
jgi:DNA-binding transcriptional LysR family regulator